VLSTELYRPGVVAKTATCPEVGPQVSTSLLLRLVVVPGVPQDEPVVDEPVVPVVVLTLLVVTRSGRSAGPPVVPGNGYVLLYVGVVVTVTVVVAVGPVVTVLVTVAVLVTGAPVSVTVMGGGVLVMVSVDVLVAVVVLVAVELASLDVRQTPPAVHAAACGRACAVASTSIGPAMTADSAAHPSKSPRSGLFRGIIFIPLAFLDSPCQLFFAPLTD
jgi:hypothetical protein